MRRLLLLGANGQVGTELQRALSPLGAVLSHTRATADLTQPERIGDLVRTVRPDVIVNAAAYTAVDKAETDGEAAARVNADSVRIMADEAARSGAWLVHYSTDYVFDGGASEPYREDSPPAPLNAYGRTKRAGEEAILGSGCKHLIFRTSWVYASHGRNFLKTILQAAATRSELQVVADQTGAPTGADLIADVTALCLYRILQDEAFAAQAGGLYHLTAGGRTSWCDYAAFAIETARDCGWKLQTNPDAVQPVTSDFYSTAAKRPLFSLLDTAKLQHRFGIALPDWRDGVRRTIAALPKVE